MRRWNPVLLLFAVGLPVAADPAGIDWQPLEGLAVARTETTVAQFRRYAQASGFVSQAERRGGGQVYENGWVQKAGWTWHSPFGAAAGDDEPAVHLTHAEAQDFCRWAGGRLPSDAEWVRAAYTEQRRAPPAPFSRGNVYPYPTGSSPQGAICLQDCGAQPAQRAASRRAVLMKGDGHAEAGRSAAGVNGLFDMGGNVWEWVDSARGSENITRGGSWWYGAEAMRAEHVQSKPPETAVVYIGFRCVRPRAR